MFDVNIIGLLSVPWADRTPEISSRVPGWNLTVTPGSINSVPEVRLALHVTMYGEPPVVHCVSAITPQILAEDVSWASSKLANVAMFSPHRSTTVTTKLPMQIRIAFFIVTSMTSTPLLLEMGGDCALFL